MHYAEIIAVGSELLTPEKVDTNSLWLTEKLNEIGVEVMLKTVVGDDAARLEEVIADALKRSFLVITTGGLGPTEDDITRQISAKAAGRELVHHEHLEDALRERFRGYGYEMPEINKRQAYTIAGSTILPNPNGSAVGMMLEDDGRFLVVLPGPPNEMRPMFTDHVLPELRKHGGGVIVRKRVICVAGMGESAVDEAVSPIYREYESVDTSILFTQTGIELHLTAHSQDEAEAAAVLDELASRIAAKLPSAVFSVNGEKMEEVVGKLLAEQNKTIAFAESCTGGLIAMRITEVAGSSEYFLEGAVTYSNDAKVRTLGVLPETLAAHGAVSAETAKEMAAGMRLRSDADIAVSITGIAGPGGGSEEKPVGTVHIGYADENGVSSIQLKLPGDRSLIRRRASEVALNYLRLRLIK
jgi:nicotinamide-nucleotide amidase